jgi:3-deoxy-7-phosphoheptulonate synthase
MTQLWSPSSWRNLPMTHLPEYPDPEALEAAIRRVSSLPPLVTTWEVLRLKERLAKAARGEMFLLQGGDCSESFAECANDVLSTKLKILLQMGVILMHGGRKGVIHVARLAGQYAKPRSADAETRGGVSLPSYRGDLVNRCEFTPEARRPDPANIPMAYERAALTLNFLRSLTGSGFADLRQADNWDLRFARRSPHAE